MCGQLEACFWLSLRTYSFSGILCKQINPSELNALPPSQMMGLKSVSVFWNFYSSPINILKKALSGYGHINFHYVYVCAVNFFLNSVNHRNVLFKTINQLTQMASVQNNLEEISHHFCDDCLQKQVILHENVLRSLNIFLFCYVFLVVNNV